MQRVDDFCYFQHEGQAFSCVHSVRKARLAHTEQSDAARQPFRIFGGIGPLGQRYIDVERSSVG